MGQTKHATVARLFEAWNSGDAYAVIDLYADEFVREDIGAQSLYGKEKLLQVVLGYLQAFPDIHYQLDNLVEKQNQVVVCWTATGTHKGKIMNIPATGKKVCFKGVSVMRIEAEKIQRVWYLWDQAGMLRQMGLLPDLQHGY